MFFNYFKEFWAFFLINFELIRINESYISMIMNISYLCIFSFELFCKVPLNNVKIVFNEAKLELYAEYGNSTIRYIKLIFAIILLYTAQLSIRITTLQRPKHSFNFNQFIYYLNRYKSNESIVLLVINL